MKKVVALGLAFMPMLAMADLAGTVTSIKGALSTLVGLILAMAVFWVIYAVYGYATSAGDAKKREEAVTNIGWGMGMIVLIVGIYGAIDIVKGILGLDAASTITPPTIN